jgi:hypothetical protein
MGYSKYTSKSLKERIELVIREEINRGTQNTPLEDFITNLIDNLSWRLTSIMEDEIRFRRF